jgi:hypothetical protein
MGFGFIAVSKPEPIGWPDVKEAVHQKLQVR